MSGEAFDAEFLVVGSGPAGVSAAVPLVEAGRDVLMVDGGNWGEGLPDPSAAASWSRFLGGKLEGLTPEDGLSPRLRMPKLSVAVADYWRLSGIRGENFYPVSAYVRGGLSQFWAGFVCEFDAADLAGWPIGISDLRPSYEAVVRRIGVSGSSTDRLAGVLGGSSPLLAPPPLGAATGRLETTYRRRADELPQFTLGRARNALLTDAANERLACDLSYGCHWGCPRGAIYDARYDVGRMQKTGRLRLVDDALVVRLDAIAGGWRVTLKDGRELRARKVVLAAGPLSTTQIVLSAIKDAPSQIRMLSNPTVGGALLMPAMLGRAGAPNGHTLAQLSFRLAYGPAASDYLMGSLYEAVALPASIFVSRMPLGRRANMQLFQALAPALLVTGIFFPGSESDHMLTVKRQGDEIALAVRGGLAPDFPSRLKDINRTLSGVWRRLGLWTLQANAVADLGTDIHYAGTLPMGGRTALSTSAFGEIQSAPGLHVVDGSVMPSLPAKSLTLTIMANADRIGRHLARRPA